MRVGVFHESEARPDVEICAGAAEAVDGFFFHKGDASGFVDVGDGIIGEA